MHNKNPHTPSSPAHAWFLEHYDEIRSRTTASLSRLDRGKREEAVAEVIASIFQSAINAARSGTLHRLTPYWCVQFACRRYRQGRRVAGSSSTDVCSEATAVGGRVRLVSLECLADEGNGTGPTLAQTLADSRKHELPLEHARRNIDFPFILEAERVGTKTRQLFHLLSQVRGRACGQKIASMLNVSPSRVCQMKRQLAEALINHGYVPT